MMCWCQGAGGLGSGSLPIPAGVSSPLGGGAVGVAPPADREAAALAVAGERVTPHQQLREILGQQTKLRMQQKAAQQQQLAGPPAGAHPALHQQWLQQQQQQQQEAAAAAAGLPPTSMMPRMPGEKLLQVNLS